MFNLITGVYTMSNLKTIKTNFVCLSKREKNLSSSRYYLNILIYFNRLNKI